MIAIHGVPSFQLLDICNSDLNSWDNNIDNNLWSKIVIQTKASFSYQIKHSNWPLSS